MADWSNVPPGQRRNLTPAQAAELLQQQKQELLDGFRTALMTLNEQVKPMHEWLSGQRAYFLSQGYTVDEARAMAACTYTTVFGTKIAGPDDEDET